MYTFMAIHRYTKCTKLPTKQTELNIEITVHLLMYRTIIPKQRVISDAQITKELLVKYHLCSINSLSTSCYPNAPCMFSLCT